MSDDPPRALIICRQSLTRPDSVSLDSQEERCRAYCHERGYAIVGVSREESVRGWKDDRQAIADAVAAAESGQATVLVAWDQSRVARSVRILETLMHDLAQHGARFESVSEPYVTQPFIRQVLAAVAEQQTRDISRNVASAKRIMAEQGRYHGGPPPYGYRLVSPGEGPSVLVPDPDEAVLVVEGYERFAAGEPVMAILRDWASRGLRGRRGAVWQAKTLWRILGNPVYRGHISHHGQIVCHDAHPPIVAAELYDRVQRGMAHRPVVHANPGRPSHWLEGLIVHSCGNRMYLMTQRHTQTRSGWQLSYICKHAHGSHAVAHRCADPRPRISDRKAARLAVACLVADLGSLETVQNALRAAETHAGGDEAARQREALQQRRTAAISRYERVRSAWADGDEPLDWLEAERARRDAVLAEVDAALAALPNAPDPVVYARIGAMLTTLAEVLDAADDTALRAMLSELGVLVIDGAGGSIRYHPRYAFFVPVPFLARL